METGTGCSSDALEPSLVPGGEAMQVLVSSRLAPSSACFGPALSPLFWPLSSSGTAFNFFLIPQRT